MNDQETKRIQQSVYQFLKLRREEARMLDVGKAEHFEELVNYVRASNGVRNQDDEVGLRMVTGLCWLGPRTGAPPLSQQEEVRQLIRDAEPESSGQCARVMEFVIAYGCGKWRDIDLSGDAWSQRWPGAIQGLQRAMELAVRESDRWLRSRAHIVGYPERSGDDLAGDAGLLALRLIHTERPVYPVNDTLSIICTEDGAEIFSEEVTGTQERVYHDRVPAGAKTVFTVAEQKAVLPLPAKEPLVLATGVSVIIAARDEELRITAKFGEETKETRLKPWESTLLKAQARLRFWNCSCGHKRCAEWHRLDAWNPVVRLRSFAASAVKGRSAAKGRSETKGSRLPIQVGSFVSGMYFSLLAKEGAGGTRLRLGDIEYKVCRSCSTLNAGVVADTRTSKPIHIGSDAPVTISMLSTLGESVATTAASKMRFLEYEGPSCFKCGSPFDPALSRRVARPRLVTVADYAPHYRQDLRIRCKNRSDHYRIMNGQEPAGALTEIWDNLFTLPAPWSYENVRSAKRALTDDQYLRSQCNDLAASLLTIATRCKRSEKMLRNNIKEWLKAPLRLACPLCGEEQRRQLSTVWERTFATIEQLDITDGNDDLVDDKAEQRGACIDEVGKEED